MLAHGETLVLIAQLGLYSSNTSMMRVDVNIYGGANVSMSVLFSTTRRISVLDKTHFI
jgi:hypothetical protein